MSLDPAIAAVRNAVRPWFRLYDSTVQLVACSGGADSLALLAACVFEAHRSAGRVVGVVVDHGLQAGSPEHTARVVEQMAGLGVDETASIRVTVDPGTGGVEAGAREARYAALGQLAVHFGASLVHLGHTRDDQAETVLLGLARGSGGRSLQGMRPSFHDGAATFARPLLGLSRAQTEAACLADAIAWWEDPHNADPAFARSRVRHTVLPTLERELGPGVTEALARTAALLRDDMDLVESLADAAYAVARFPGGVDLKEVVEPALRSRLVRRAAIDAGAIAQELTRAHVMSVLALDRGKQLPLPGHVTVTRDGEVLRFERPGEQP